jgi:starch-binding outer membrane protein, SusD/RagB family
MTTRRLAWVVLAGLIAACDSPLDTNPTTSIDAGTALTSARGIELAVNGAYRQLQSASLYARQELAFSDMYSDNLNYTGTFTGDREVSIRAIQPSNGEVSGIWSSSYVGINRTNFILDALDDVADLTAEQKASYRGQMLWLRGLFYSLLVKYYGGVPLVDKPTQTVDSASINLPRATQVASYAFIVKDLEEAATLLSPARANGRATQGAANALLARVYLEMSDYAKARDKATSVIGNTAYGLVPNFNSLWDLTSKNSAESIYEVQFTTTNSNSAAFWFAPTALGGRLGFAPTPDLYNAFEVGDTRRDASITTHSSGQRWGYKYRQIGPGTDNIPVMRLAEQYLIRAEANARLNATTATIHADINVVRTRAGLPALAATVTTQQALLDAILQERRVEFAFEGFRFMDLRRHGKAQALLGIAAEKLLWPVPQSERDVNPNLQQNPGY